MADGVSIAASIVTLLNTAGALTITFHNLFATFNDAPNEINSLHKEYNSIQAVLGRLRRLINPEDDANLDRDIAAQLRIVIGDTQHALEELHENIASLVPSRAGPSRSGAVRVRLKYMWNEKTIRATLLRLKAQRDALSLILNMWTSADSTEIKRELCGIRTTLESYLVDLHGGDGVPESDACQQSDVSSNLTGNPRSEPGSDVTSVTSFSEQSSTRTVADLRRRFERALANAVNNGPQGEAITACTQNFNARTSAIVASNLAQGTGSSGNLMNLIRKLSAAEAAASGLSSEESASAAENLARAYQDAGLLETALEYYHQALAAREYLLGPAHRTTLITLDNIAAIFEIQSRWQEALDYYQIALDRRVTNPAIGPHHPSVLPTATRVARMLGKTGQTDAALEEYERILAKYKETTNGGTGAAALAVRSDIAIIHLEQGQDEALAEARSVREDCKEVLNMRETKLGPEHRLTKEIRAVYDAISKAISKLDSHPPPLDPGPSSPTQNDDSSTETLIRPSNGSPSNDLDQVIQEYERTLSITRQKHGDNHPETLQLMCSLAEAYESHGHYEPAISWLQEAIRGQEITFGRMHPVTLATMHGLAVCYGHRGENSLALQFFDRALTGRTQRLGKHHPSTLNTLKQLALVYKALGELAKAIELLNRAIAGYQDKYGPQHQSTLSAKFLLADVYREKGSSERAATLHEEVLVGRKEAHGSDHPSVFTSMYTLALTYRESGQDARAIPWLYKALEGQQSIFGKLHSTPARTAAELAEVYYATQEFRKALEYYLVLLEAIQNEQPGEARAGAVTMSNIATCYSQLEEFERAIPWYEKVLKIYEKEHGPDDNRTLNVAEGLARACAECEKFDDAVQHFQRILAQKEKSPDADDKAIVWIVFQLASCTYQTGQYERSLFWSNRILSFGENVEAESRLVIMRRMAIVYSKQGRDSEAMNLLEEVLNQSKLLLPKDHWLIKGTVEDIKYLYMKMDKEVVDHQSLARERSIIQQLLETDGPSGLVLLCKLGDVHARQHMYQEALSIYEEALDALQCVSDDPDMSSLKHQTISDIADTHLALYNNEAAMTYLQILIGSKEDDSWKHGALIRMGTAHENLSNFNEAIGTFKQVLRETERKSGLNGINTLRCVRKIGSLNLRVGNTQESLRWTQRAVKGFRESDDPEGEMEALTSLSLMSVIQYEQGDYESALITQQECTEGFEEKLGPLHEKTLGAALDLANLYSLWEREEEALLWYKKALNGYRAHLGDRPAKALQAETKIKELEDRGVTVREV